MKSRGVAAILAIFLGGLGIHKFYLGRISGIFYLLFCWTFIPLVIGVFEGIFYLCISDKSFDEIFNSKYIKDKIAPIENVNITDEINKLWELKEKGIITESDFYYKKNQLLGKIK